MILLTIWGKIAEDTKAFSLTITFIKRNLQKKKHPDCSLQKQEEKLRGVKKRHFQVMDINHS